MSCDRESACVDLLLDHGQYGHWLFRLDRTVRSLTASAPDIDKSMGSKSRSGRIRSSLPEP